MKFCIFRQYILNCRFSLLLMANFCWSCVLLAAQVETIFIGKSFNKETPKIFEVQRFGNGNTNLLFEHCKQGKPIWIQGSEKELKCAATLSPKNPSSYLLITFDREPPKVGEAFWSPMWAIFSIEPLPRQKLWSMTTFLTSKDLVFIQKKYDRAKDIRNLVMKKMVMKKIPYSEKSSQVSSEASKDAQPFVLRPVKDDIDFLFFHVPSDNLYGPDRSLTIYRREKKTLWKKIGIDYSIAIVEKVFVNLLEDPIPQLIFRGPCANAYCIGIMRIYPEPVLIAFNKY